MANPIDGTKAPHHGLFYMENAGGHHLEPQEPASPPADDRQSGCFALEEEKRGRLEGRRRIEVGHQ